MNSTEGDRNIGHHHRLRIIVSLPNKNYALCTTAALGRHLLFIYDLVKPNHVVVFYARR